MGKKRKKPIELKDVVIDADSIMYGIASTPPKSREYGLKGKKLGKVTNGIGNIKKAFKAKVESYVKIAEVESIAYKWGIGETIVVISDKTNFRYKIFPEYKANRKGRTHTYEFIKLREWAQKKYAPRENIEADDKVAYLVSKGALGFSIDKDLVEGVAGIWFDCYHERLHWKRTGAKEARHFNLIQCIAGDYVDGINGIQGVAKTTAIKLLNKYGWSWDGVLSAYAQYGLSSKDAVLTLQLTNMNQWKPNKGIKLKRKL